MTNAQVLGGFSGVLRLAVVHAKLATIVSDDGRWHIAIESSANLNSAKRIEAHTLSDDPGLVAFIDATIGEWFTGDGADDF